MNVEENIHNLMIQYDYITTEGVDKLEEALNLVRSNIDELSLEFSKNLKEKLTPVYREYINDSREKHPFYNIKRTLSSYGDCNLVKLQEKSSELYLELYNKLEDIIEEKDTLLIRPKFRY